MKRTLLFFAFIFACGDSVPSTAQDSGSSDSGAAPSLTGDWFFCFAPDCSTVDRKGLGFIDDSHYVSLVAPHEGWTPPGAYCRQNPPGTYSWNASTGQLDTTSPTGMTDNVSFVRSGDGSRATVTHSPDPAAQMRRLDTLTSTVICP